MKVQWQLIDLETKEIIAFRESFDLIVESVKDEWKKQYHGTSIIKNPIGLWNRFCKALRVHRQLRRNLCLKEEIKTK